jgi:hypothetical protein
MITISNLLYLEEIDMPCSDGLAWDRDMRAMEEAAMKKRLDRYVRQFCNVTHLLSKEQITDLLMTDLEFRDTYIEHQETDRTAGRDWYEVKVSDAIYMTDRVDVEVIFHAGTGEA